MEFEHARQILDLAQSAFISMDEAGRITYWNIRAEEMFGLTREQALGRVLADTVIPEHLRAAHNEGLKRYLECREGPLLNRRNELSALAADGREIPVEMTISALEHAGRPAFHAFLLDISDRHAAERERELRLTDLQGALRDSERRFAVVVDGLAEAVTIRGPDDRLIYANRAALERLGMTSVEELREADPRALLGSYETRDEAGAEIQLDDLPSVRVLRGEEPEPLLMRTLSRDRGEEQWLLLKAAALRGSAGEIEAAVTIIEDVTDYTRAAMRAEFLASAGQVLASSLDYEQTLRNVAGLAVPRVADWCAVDLFDERGTRQAVAVAHIDPAKLETAARLRAYEPERLDTTRGLGRVWLTGEPILYREIGDELLVASAQDEEHLRLLREVGLRSLVIVPMQTRGRTIGALTLVGAESGRSLDRDDLEFAMQIAERAALAVESARLYRGRNEVAETLQSSLLPAALPAVEGWEIAALYRPAGEEADVGGDFYDVWEVGGEWLMMIGDATGKGVDAATVTSLVRHTAWAASEFDTRPAQVLARVDAALKRRPGMPICTALCLRLGPDGGMLATGGHPPLLHISDRGVSEIGTAGPLLGAFPNVEWPEAPFALRAGETLIAITDGVTDTIGAGGERFGPDRLARLIESGYRESPVALRARMLAGLEAFQVGPQTDDTAVVIMRFTGISATPVQLRMAATSAGV